MSAGTGLCEFAPMAKRRGAGDGLTAVRKLRGAHPHGPLLVVQRAGHKRGRLLAPDGVCRRNRSGSRVKRGITQAAFVSGMQSGQCPGGFGLAHQARRGGAHRKIRRFKRGKQPRGQVG